MKKRYWFAILATATLLSAQPPGGGSPPSGEKGATTLTPEAMAKQDVKWYAQKMTLADSTQDSLYKVFYRFHSDMKLYQDNGKAGPRVFDSLIKERNLKVQKHLDSTQYQNFLSLESQKPGPGNKGSKPPRRPENDSTSTDSQQ